MVSELRRHCVSVRLAPDELAALDRRRGRVRRGAFLRKLFLGKKEPRQIPVVNTERYAETARWAANLNQIARGLNTKDTPDIEEICRILAQFRRSLIGLKDGEVSDS